MENNLSNTELVIKQEVVYTLDANEQERDCITSSVDIKPELVVRDSSTPECIQESTTTNSSENLQNPIEKTTELVSSTDKEISTQTKAKRSMNNKRKEKNIKQKSQNTKYEDIDTVKQISVNNKKQNVNNNDLSATVKEEVKDVNEIIAAFKADAEESNNISRISCRKRKSNEVLIKNENFHQNDGSEAHKRKQKSRKINKINKSRNKKAGSNKAQKKNLEKTQDSNKIKNANVDENNLSDSDNRESDFQDFFDSVKPKKRRYRPRQKSKLSEEERAEKERQKLERRTCQICSAVFALPDGLRNHIRSKHTFEKPYSCKFCGEQFSTRSSHSMHRRRHHGFQPFLCNLCGKTFLQKAHMEIHMRIHIPSKDKIRDVKCSFCPNVYTSKLNLKKHILTKHTDPSEWKHECNICSKKCFSTTDLTHHMRRHNDERKYKCVICGRGFFTKQTMNVHFRTHSASTAFNCERCSKGYRSNEALQHHMLKVHGIGQEKTVSAPKHFCPICNEGFRQRARLEKHLVIHETGEEEYPFKCERCNKQYKARNYFTIHMLDKHKEFLDDAYFKTHFKLNMEENYTNFNEDLDVEDGNSNNAPEFL